MFTLTKNNVFVGKGYAIDGMLKLNLKINKIASSAYMLSSINVWHARLFHIDKRLISNISWLNLIHKLSLHDFEKCACCSQTKITKTSHKSVARVTEPLKLIHSNLRKFDGTLFRNSKRYVITFINDSFDYTFIYLLKNKSDVYDMFKVFITEIENQELRDFVVIEELNMIQLSSMSFITQKE